MVEVDGIWRSQFLGSQKVPATVLRPIQPNFWENARFGVKFSYRIQWSYRAECSFPLLDLGHCARRWIKHLSVWRTASAMPDLRYLPSRKSSSPFDRYHVVLLGDRGTCVWTTCLRLFRESGTAGSRTATLWVASPTPEPSHDQGGATQATGCVRGRYVEGCWTRICRPTRCQRGTDASSFDDRRDALETSTGRPPITRSDSLSPQPSPVVVVRLALDVID